MRFVVVSLAVILVGLSACGNTAETTTSASTTTTTSVPAPTISGTLTIVGLNGFRMGDTHTGSIIRNGDNCEERSSSSRIVIRDGQGTVIGTGSLDERGFITGLSEDVNLDELTLGDPLLGDVDECTFPFAVTLATEAAFYSIEIDDRGELTYSHQELENLGWDVALTFG